MTILEVIMMSVLILIATYSCYMYGYTRGVSAYHSYVKEVFKKVNEQSNVTNINSRRF